MPEILEKGDIYFLYRNKTEVDRATSTSDIQRLYIVTVPDDNADKSRLLMVGKKRMPKLDSRRSRGREWMMNILTDRPQKIGETLGPIRYQTKTRGSRRISEAFPAGEGRYALVAHDDHTELAYRLVNPEHPGRPQQEMELKPEASYVISVRNPDIKVKGFPDASPDYPKSLKKLFAKKRWIDISDPALLNYENAHLLLVGAHERLDEIDLKIPGKPRLFKNLGLKKKEWSTDALFEGRYARTQQTLDEREPDEDPSKGGRKGGKRALSAPSAAGVASALKGIDLPRRKRGLIDYARDHGVDSKVIETLKALPNRKFNTMADVQKALAEVR